MNHKQKKTIEIELTVGRNLENEQADSSSDSSSSEEQEETKESIREEGKEEAKSSSTYLKDEQYIEALMNKLDKEKKYPNTKLAK